MFFMFFVNKIGQQIYKSCSDDAFIFILLIAILK